MVYSDDTGRRIRLRVKRSTQTTAHNTAGAVPPCHESTEAGHECAMCATVNEGPNKATSRNA